VSGGVNWLFHGRLITIRCSVTFDTSPPRDLFGPGLSRWHHRRQTHSIGLGLINPASFIGLSDSSVDATCSLQCSHACKSVQDGISVIRFILYKNLPNSEHYCKKVKLFPPHSRPFIALFQLICLQEIILAYS